MHLLYAVCQEPAPEIHSSICKCENEMGKQAANTKQPAEPKESIHGNTQKCSYTLVRVFVTRHILLPHGNHMCKFAN